MTQEFISMFLDIKIILVTLFLSHTKIFLQNSLFLLNLGRYVSCLYLKKQDPSQDCKELPPLCSGFPSFWHTIHSYPGAYFSMITCSPTFFSLTDFKIFPLLLGRNWCWQSCFCTTCAWNSLNFHVSTFAVFIKFNNHLLK